VKSERRKFGKILLFTVLFAMLVFVSIVGCASAATIFVPTDYATIQEAVDAASPGDTVFVYNGTYYDDDGVKIEKDRITLQGEDANTTTIHGKWAAEEVVYVSGDYVNVSGFTVTGSSSSGSGIFLSCSCNCRLSRNNATDNNYGIWLSSSSNNNLTGNSANNNNRYGIWLTHSSNSNNLTDNSANNNYRYGIFLQSGSNHNNLTGNSANNNDCGIYLYSSSNNLTGNSANNNYRGIYLDYSSNHNLTGNSANNNDLYGIFLTHSSNNNLTGNSAINNRYGIYLDSSKNNELKGNTADANSYGIRLESMSTENNITENTFTNNTEYGMYLDYSGNNEIYHNNFIDNVKQAYDHRGFNKWDKGPIIGGNYWSDHVCHGNPSDGTEPYTEIDTDAGVVDNYPFEDPGGWVTPPQKPAVSVSTDKVVYNPGDTMIVTLSFKNPTTESIDTYFIWYFGLPDYGYWKQILVTPFTLPPGCDHSYNMSIPIGNWGAVGFNATWYIALLETSAPYETICEDTADWKYVPTAKTQGEIMPEEIAKEIMKKVRR